MITARQQYYFLVLVMMTFLGGGGVIISTLGDEIPWWTGWILAICLLSVGFPLLLILLKEDIQDLRLLSNGKRVQGRIKSIERNVWWINAPVVIHYVYKVDGKEFEGSTWTTAFSLYLRESPREGSECLVIYDERNPQRSIVENLLK